MNEKRRTFIAAGSALMIAVCPALLAAEPELPSSRPADCEAVRLAAERAKGFLESLAPEMDPVRLRREHQMKGKKFYVEYLNGWWDLYQIADAAERKAIRDFLASIVERTRNPAYHNLETSSDLEFKQDIISYLSACVLHEHLGFDAAEYREHIRRIVPRTLSPQHLSIRGVDNTMALVYRLRQLGHGPELDYRALWDRPGCVSREHPDLTLLDLSTSRGWMRVYDLTHEIFYLTEFGSTPMQCASAEDLDYLRQTHARLIPIFMGLTNVDMVSELVMDLNYLRMTDLPEHRTAREFILQRQNEDGSWGDHAHIARHVKQHFWWNPSYLPKVGQYLHTTEVTLNALLYPCWDTSRATSKSTSAPVSLPSADLQDEKAP